MIAEQVCTSPDYLLVHFNIKEKFIEEFSIILKKFYPQGALSSEDYSRIVNVKNYDRLIGMLKSVNLRQIVVGGKYDDNLLKIEPTIIDEISWNDKIMETEIFGPLIPVIEYDVLDEVIAAINQHPKPLALNIYSRNKKNINKVIDNTSSGGVGINVSIQHFFNKNLPFGGVGMSGIGKYRGKYGLFAFSNQKSVLDNKLFFETDLLDPPYRNKSKYIKMMLR